MRRPLAATLLATAAGLGTHAVTADPAAGVAVVVAARDLPAGHALGAGDLTTVRLPAEAVPDGARTPHDDVAGHALAAAVRRGEPLTDVRLRGAGTLASAPAGSVVTTVRLPDPLTASLLRPGDRVDLLAADPLDPLDPRGSAPARAVASRAVVLEVHHPDADLLGASDAQPLALLALAPAQARAVAGAQADGPLSLVLLP